MVLEAHCQRQKKQNKTTYFNRFVLWTHLSNKYTDAKIVNETQQNINKCQVQNYLIKEKIWTIPQMNSVRCNY